MRKRLNESNELVKYIEKELAKPVGVLQGLLQQLDRFNSLMQKIMNDLNEAGDDNTKIMAEMTKLNDKVNYFNGQFRDFNNKIIVIDANISKIRDEIECKINEVNAMDGNAGSINGIYARINNGISVGNNHNTGAGIDTGRDSNHNTGPNEPNNVCDKINYELNRVISDLLNLSGAHFCKLAIEIDAFWKEIIVFKDNIKQMRKKRNKYQVVLIDLNTIPGRYMIYFSRNNKKETQSSSLVDNMNNHIRIQQLQLMFPNMVVLIQLNILNPITFARKFRNILSGQHEFKKLNNAINRFDCRNFDALDLLNVFYEISNNEDETYENNNIS